MGKKEKQTYIEPSTIYGPNEMLEWCATTKPNSLAKALESSIPFETNFKLFDISLNTSKHKFEEDSLYTKELFLRNNIRRGNSVLIQAKNPKEQSEVDQGPLQMIMNYHYSDAWFVRRGMQKFFDLYPEFTYQSNTKNLNTLGSFAGNFPIRYSSQDSQKELLRKIIFYDAEEAIIREQASVDVYKTNKANGENAQVSYARPIDAWIISSKNVSIAIRSEEDFDKLGLERYNFAKLIGIEWFKYISTLSRDLIEDLKNDLDGFTFVGEYVGNKEYQHLVKYNETSILFFACVDNNSSYSFMPPLKAFTLFEKYHLNRVKVEYIGNMKTLDELYANLGDLYNKISSEALIDEGEGSVIYLLKNQNKDSSMLYAANAAIFGNQPSNFTEEELSQVILSQTALSASKMKTLEYRIFRKLREKIKNMVSEKKKMPAKTSFQKFINEVQELAREIELPKPLDYYFKIAEVAFAFVEKQKLLGKKFKEGYIDFLDMIIDRVNANKNPEILDDEINSDQFIADLSPLIVTIITPPFVLEDPEKQAICDALKPTKIEKAWNRKMIIKEGLTICFPIGFVAIENPVPNDTLFVFYRTTDDGFHKATETIAECQREKNKPQPSGMAGFIKGDPVKKMENFQSKVAASKLFIEENRRDYVLEAFDIDLSSFILALGMKIDSLRNKIPEETKSVESTLAIDDTSNKIFVIVPMGVPAMGKSFIIKSFKSAVEQQEGITFSVVSSDKIREECMQDYMETNKNWDKDNAFEKTNKSARTKFAKEISKEMETKSKCHVIFLDKNHPPNSLPRTFVDINKNAPKKTQIRVIGLVPECSTPFVINDDKRDQTYTYELSLSFLMQCLVRVRNRIEHETLTGSLSKKISVVMMMYNMYRNVKFDDLLNEGFHYIMRLPFTEENAFEVDENMRLVVTKTLLAFRPESIPNENIVRELAEIIDQYADRLPKIDPIPKINFEVAKLFDFRKKGNVNFEEETKEPVRRKEEIVKAKEENVKSAEEIKQVRKKGRPEPKNFKLPLYIGIDTEKCFKPLLVPIVVSCLREFADAYGDENIIKDLQDIQNAAIPGINLEHFSETWKIVNDLHVTSLFLGGNNKLTNSIEYRDFVENKEIDLALTHIVYVPRHIICAPADKFNPHIKIANKCPHVTLLTGKWTAKYSNDVLSSIPLEPGISRHPFPCKEGQLEAYSISLSPKIAVKGITKKYFN